MDSRGMINTDVPTLENHLTGQTPAHVPTRLAHDGAVDLSRRYAPDDAPNTVQILALSRLPLGFGEYADGMIMIYSTERMGTPAGPQLVDHLGQHYSGYLNGKEYPTGYWARVYDATIRIAVHRATSSVEGYATGWVVLDWHRDLVPTSTDVGVSTISSLSRYGAMLGNPTGLASPQWTRPACAFAVQRLGEFVILSYEPNGFGAGLTNADNDFGIFRVTSDLEVISGSKATFTSGFLSESADPVLWGAQGLLSTAAYQATVSDLMKPGPPPPTVSSTYTLFDTVQCGAIAQAFSSGRYSAPDAWLFDAQFAGIGVYRVPWQRGAWKPPNFSQNYDDPDYTTGRTTLPKWNPEGWAYDADWKSAKYKVGIIPPLPNYLGVFDPLVNGTGDAPLLNVVLVRDENIGAMIALIATLGPVKGDTYYAGGALHIQSEWYPSFDTAPIADNANFLGQSALADQQYSNALLYAGTLEYVPGRPDTRPSQIWTSVSYDDGKTWSKPLAAERQMTPRPGAYATQWAQWGGSPRPGAIAMSADGSLIMGVTETFVYATGGDTPSATDGRFVLTSPDVAGGAQIGSYSAADLASVGLNPVDLLGPPQGGRVPFWTGPSDAGARITFYVPFSTSAFGVGSSSPDGVIYKHSQVST